ncbi:MAG: AzlD domain-containing protein [Oscillospiraceae bacterium]|nr:AzlD domain-containing protein [Oscillospiraceae bacterium]
MKLYIYIIIMALVTYLIRMIPFALVRKKIRSKFIQSFLYYIPYSVLSAMTIPAIFYSTSGKISAAAGFITAVLLSLKNRSLITVALLSCAAAFAADLIVSFI